MDIFVLKALVDDLRQYLGGAVVSKVFQISADTLLLRLWRRQDWRLLMSIQPTLPRLHLTTERFQHPSRPPRFAALLRARLQHTRLQRIAVQPYERVVTLTWEHPDNPPLTLVHELLGTQSNLLLVDAEGYVIDTCKRIPPHQAHHRTLLPGQPYQPPLTPPQRVSLADVTCAHLEALHQHNAFDTPHLQRLLRGIAPGMLTELLHRSHGNPQTYWQLLRQLRHDYDHGTLRLTVITRPDGTRQVSALPLTHSAVAYETFDSAQDAVAAVYQPRMHVTREESLRLALQKTVRQRQQKLHKKIANLENDAQKLHTYLSYQRYGTLLVSHHAPRGATSVTVVDYYSPDQASLTIPLDPRLSVAENAERYFKKYRKAKSGRSKVEALLAQYRAEARRLTEVTDAITHAVDWPTLEALHTALHGDQPPAPQQSRAHPKPAPAPPYRLFMTSTGAKLYCGKNDRGNAALLRHIARPQDLWFHAHGHAGAHVLLQTQSQEEISQSMLVEAAALAAFYSKGKHAAAVEVIYTEAKHVHSFRGARPGQVRVETYRTLEVAPRLPESSSHTPPSSFAVAEHQSTPRL
jgi:predicted ribosome quality control (RQC) complex YloA/Tae2 family protein